MTREKMAAKPKPVADNLKESGYDINAHNWLEKNYWMVQYQFYLHSLLTSHYLVTLSGVNKPQETRPTVDNRTEEPAQRNVDSDIIGYEVFTATFLRRIIAEAADFIFIILFLTLTVSGFDIRIPEDALLQINFENLPVEVLEEVEELLFVFLRSMTLLHIVKWVMEVVMVRLFYTTPGKWLCGLRVLHCERFIRTNTAMPFSVKVEPGTSLPLKWSLLRATAKAAIAMCTPILVLLMFTRSGRMKYDELSRSAVVHVAILCKPIFKNPNNRQQ